MTTTPSPDQLLAANEDAAEFYRRHLLGPDGDGPRRYLTQRGFAALLDDTPWTVGHAPPGWTALHDHLSGLGYSDHVQLAAGLTSISRHGHLIDRFRDRLTFGIRDHQDRLVGFTARIGPDGRDPKYLNTPTTDLFRKGEVLFGQGEATRAPAPSCVLVEGPLDAIAMHIAEPATAALALCGTALTHTHAEAIRTSTYERVILTLDGDAAGTRALENTAATLHDQRALALTPSVGQDPASMLEGNGPQSLADVLSTARPAAEVLLELHLTEWPDRLENAEAAIACLRETANMIAKVQPQDTATLAARLSQETRLALVTVTVELTAAVSSFTPAQMPRTDHRTACAPAPVSPGERRQTSSMPGLRR